MNYTVNAIIPAGGTSSRFGKTNKLLEKIDGKEVIKYTVEAFEASNVQKIIICANVAIIDELRNIFQDSSKVQIIEGGASRQKSVFNGLNASECDYVLIHDGARPMVSEDILERCFQDAQKYNACVAAVPVKDTIKIADENGFAETTPRRDRVWQVQTPQTFSFGLIYDAYARLAEQKDTLAGKGIKITDVARVVETFTDHQVKLTEGSYRNLKVTTPEDLPLAEKYLHS